MIIWCCTYEYDWNNKNKIKSLRRQTWTGEYDQNNFCIIFLHCCIKILQKWTTITRKGYFDKHLVSKALTHWSKYTTGLTPDIILHLKWESEMRESCKTVSNLTNYCSSFSFSDSSMTSQRMLWRHSVLLLLRPLLSLTNSCSRTKSRNHFPRLTYASETRTRPVQQWFLRLCIMAIPRVGQRR